MISTFGSVQYLGGRSSWAIRCEPHVRARLKRVFPRAPQHAAEVLFLSASPENTRELLWFLQRYPMDVDRPDVLERLSDEHIATEQRLADLLASRIDPITIDLAEPPRAYQTIAAQMLDVRRGYLLADDLGLGKTVSAIAAMVTGERRPALVVCPAHLPRQWKRMINRFAPALNVHVIKKGSIYPIVPSSGPQGNLPLASLPDVIISSYHKLRGWAETLAGIAQFIVFDECQALRSPGTQIHRAATLVASRGRWAMGLSATPIYNYGSEFFHVINVLAPGVLGEHDEFIREWCSPAPGGNSRLKDAEDFGAYLRREGIMLRRTRADVGRELPELQKVVHEIDADEAAIELLKGDAIALAKIVLSHNERFRGEKMQAAGEFDALMRQATGIAKAPYVVQFVKLLLDAGERVVLYGWHRNVYTIWLEGLSDFNPMMYTGTESAPQKDASVREFVEGRSQLLIMSLRSGAGVDGLQGAARTVIFGELDWSPGVHEQCIGRVHRDGQDEPCVAYFLISESGSDPIMAEVLGVKREQIEGVRNPGTALAERINTGETSISSLARDFLRKRGVELPADASVSELLS